LPPATLPPLRASLRAMLALFFHAFDMPPLFMMTLRYAAMLCCLLLDAAHT